MCEQQGYHNKHRHDYGAITSAMFAVGSLVAGGFEWTRCPMARGILYRILEIVADLGHDFIGAVDP